MTSKTCLLAGYRTARSPIFQMKTWTWRKNERESTRMKNWVTFLKCGTCPRWVEMILNTLCVSESGSHWSQATHTAVVLLLTRHTGEPSYLPSTESVLECLLERWVSVPQRIYIQRRVTAIYSLHSTLIFATVLWPCWGQWSWKNHNVQDADWRHWRHLRRSLHCWTRVGVLLHHHILENAIHMVAM